MSKKSRNEHESRPNGDWRVALGLALLVLLLFVRTVTYDYVRLDDWPYVLENPHVLSGLSWETVRWAFTSSYASNWHPLTWLSHALDCELFGTDPGPAHAVNVLLHAMNSALLFLALRRATGAFWTSALVAAAFAVHPLRVESVAWISERKDVLAAFFWMIALVGYEGYARTASRRAYGVVVAATALGLLCKPVLVTLPFALLLLDYWPLGRLRRSTARALLIEKLPLAALAGASAAVTMLVQRSAGSVSSLEVIPLQVRALNAVGSYFEYVRLTIWPSGLACFYPHPFGVEVDPMPRLAVPAVLGGVLLLGGSALVLRFRSRAPYLVTGWAWYLLVLVPMIGLVQVGGQSHADRYTYLPSIGLFLMGAFGLAAWAGSGATSLRRAVPGASRTKAASTLVTVSLLACVWVTWKQVAVWKNSITLLEHAISVTEKNYLAHNNLGQEYTTAERFDEAIEQFEAALEAKPELALAHYNIGYVHLLRQDLEQGAVSFREAIRIDPDHGKALNNLGRIYDLSGDQRQAADLYERAVASPSAPALAAKNLAWLRATSPDLSLRDGPAAVRWAEHYANAVGTDRVDALETLAAARAQVGDFTNAVALQAAAMERAPEAQRERMRVHLQQYRQQTAYQNVD